MPNFDENSPRYSAKQLKESYWRGFQNAGVAGFPEEVFTAEHVKSAYEEGAKETAKATDSLLGAAVRSGHEAGFKEGVHYGKVLGAQEVRKSTEGAEVERKIRLAEEAAYRKGSEEARTRGFKDGYEEGRVDERKAILNSYSFQQFFACKRRDAYLTTKLKIASWKPRPPALNTGVRASVLFGIGSVGLFAAGTFARKLVVHAQQEKARIENTRR